MKFMVQRAVELDVDRAVYRVPGFNVVRSRGVGWIWGRKWIEMKMKMKTKMKMKMRRARAV